MVTYCTKPWSLLADDDVTTVGALPDLISISAEYNTVLNVLQKIEVALLMVFLNCCNHLKECCYLGKAFFPSIFGKTRIHIGPLVVFPFSSILKVYSGSGNFTTFLEKLIPNLGMFFLITSGLFEKISYLDIPFLAGLRGVVGILVSCL